jgi:outer membrane protein TolC
MLTPLAVRRSGREIRCSRRSALIGMMTVLLVLLATTLPSGKTAHAQSADTSMPDYSRGPDWFPHFIRPFTSQPLPAVNLANSERISQLAAGGKLALSLAWLNAAVVENNLDLAAARLNNFVAQADVLRAKSGQAPRGVTGAPIPSGLFAGSIGAGLGQVGGGGGIGSAGGVSASGKAVTGIPRGTLDPTILVNFSYDHPTSPLLTSRISGVDTVTTPTTYFQVSYQQMFTSGTTVSASFANQFQSSTQKSLLYNPLAATRFSMVVTQQLLNGFGFAANRSLLTVARNNTRITRELFRQSAITALVQAQNAYWDLIAAGENVRVAERSLAVARNLYGDNKERAAIGTMAELDVTAAEAEMTARRRDLIVAQTALQTRQLDLKNMISKDLVAGIAEAALEPLDALPDPSDSDIPRTADAIAVARQNRPELRQAEQSMANQDVVVRFTRNSMRPTLTAFALLASAGLSGDQLISNTAGVPFVLSGGYGGALNQMGRFAFPEYAVGISLNLSIKNRAAQSDNIRSRLERRQVETAMQQTQNQIELEVRKAVIGLVQGKAQVEAARMAVQLRKEMMDGEQLKLEAGVSTPYQVTLMQRDYFAAQSAEVRARVAYARALVEMGRATGTTLERAKIDLDEVMAGHTSNAMLH